MLGIYRLIIMPPRRASTLLHMPECQELVYNLSPKIGLGTPGDCGLNPSRLILDATNARGHPFPFGA